MLIKVMSLSEVQNYQPSEKSLLISVYDDEPHNIEKGYKDVIDLSFHDVNPRSNLPRGIKLFNREMAKQVSSMLENSYHEIVVHCHAGVTRSASIGLALAWKYHDRKLEQELLSNKYVLNTNVVKTMAHQLDVYISNRRKISDYDAQLKKRIQKGD